MPETSIFQWHCFLGRLQMKQRSCHRQSVKCRKTLIHMSPTSMEHKNQPNYLNLLNNEWWRRRELNPRPKTINLGFYMLILNFIIGRDGSSRMDTDRRILKNSTLGAQETQRAVLQSRRPDLNLQEGYQEDGSSLKLLQRNHNRLRLYLKHCQFHELTKDSACYLRRQNLRRNHCAPKL